MSVAHLYAGSQFIHMNSLITRAHMRHKLTKTIVSYFMIVSCEMSFDIKNLSVN